MDTIKIGDSVKWLGSSYEVVEINNSKVYLKQKFSIGLILPKPIDISEIKKNK